MAVIKRIILFLVRKVFIKINDKTYLKMNYKIIFGNKLNLNNPATFNEKMQWLKLYNRKDEYTIMVDKYSVKDYISKRIGKEYVIPTIGIYDDFDQIEFDKLPDQFVMKCTHDSGRVFIFKDKSKINIKSIKRQMNKNLRRKYYCLVREWPYKNVKPRILIEKYMIDDVYDDLIDYKFMCFSGNVKYCFVYSGRKSKEGLAIDIFDKEWNSAPFKRHDCNYNTNLIKPKNYDRMVEIASTLSKDMPFIRVDLYEINGRIYFGELTFYPSAGLEKFYPEIWDKKLGDMIALPSEN